MFMTRRLTGVVVGRGGTRCVTLCSLIFKIVLIFNVLVHRFILSGNVSSFDDAITFFTAIVMLATLCSDLRVAFGRFLLPHVRTFLFYFSTFRGVGSGGSTISFPRTPAVGSSGRTAPSIVRSTPAARRAVSRPSRCRIVHAGTVTRGGHTVRAGLRGILGCAGRAVITCVDRRSLGHLYTCITRCDSNSALRGVSPMGISSRLGDISVVRFK